MKKIIIAALISLCSVNISAQMGGVVHDPQAAIQRESNFAKSLQTSLESIATTRKVVDAQKDLLNIYGDVGSAFNTLSMLKETQTVISQISDSHSKIKHEISNNTNLYDVEKYRMYDQLSVHLEKVVGKSSDITQICSNMFKSDSGTRMQSLRSVLDDLKVIDTDMRKILVQAKTTSQKRVEKKKINSLIFLGR